MQCILKIGQPNQTAETKPAQLTSQPTAQPTAQPSAQSTPKPEDNSAAKVPLQPGLSQTTEPVTSTPLPVKPTEEPPKRNDFC